ncbi:OmpA family protein [Flavobacterium sp. PL002]|uniref:OmpA family protein n=1 Tax=Flavobacterium sp. PL002 TaxID=1897058 RepID=UPI001788499E|nr:OmpA family protein [Flavobacterium sp. PL002]MBE0390786.1 Peptidoglycan-associated lipoprotein [Flavobacterium sp. PL002]
MAKGVKKIKWSQVGKVVSSLSIPEKKLVIQPDQFVYFEVEKWYDGTTASDKKKDITWMLQHRRSNKIIEIVLLKRLPASNRYAVKIPRNLCGPFEYYLEASLSGAIDRINQTGLIVRGSCTSKIIGSKWCTTNDGKDIRKEHVFKYGETIYLNLTTQGLNGHLNLSVDIFRNIAGTNDPVVFRYTSVDVIDGEINVKMDNTFAWYSKITNMKETEEFFVKVFDPAKKTYIPDNNKDTIHARFLRIEKKITSKEIKPSTNLSPLKTGEADKNYKNYHSCKYRALNIDDIDYFNIFEEGTTFLKKPSSFSKKKISEVFFDFDKDTLRDDAKHSLDNIFNFLVSNYNISMILTGHADDRGTIEYNQNLSERRAIAVKEYFFNKGLQKSKITTRGFGELRPKKQGNTELIYQQNRRTQIQFSYLEYNAEALIYETIASSVEKGKEISLIIKDRKTTSCFRENEDKHKSEVVIIHKENTVRKTGEIIKQKVVSTVESDFVPNYFYYLMRYLNPFSILYNKYDVYVNTCAYYADKTKPAFTIKVYPDIVWIGHFQYNYATRGDYFFHNKKNLELKTGISDIIDELTNSTVFKVLKVLPSTWIYEYVILEYIKTQANDYTYGAHVIYERDQEQKGLELSLTGSEVNLITQTKYTKYAAAAVVLYFVLLGIVIDLVMIYLTRGKNLQGRVAKIAKKVKAFKKIIDDSGVEIVPPSIAINAGMYYWKQADGRMALIYEANLNANPIVALNFEKEFDLLEMLKSKLEPVRGEKPKNKKLEENKSVVLEALKESGIQVLKGSFTVKGEWAMEIKVKYNFLTKSYDIKDNAGNFIDNSKAQVTTKEQITINVMISGKYDKTLFKFSPLETSIEGKMQIKMKGAAALKTKFDFNKEQGLSMKKTLIFSGIKGTFTGNVSVKNKTFGTIFDIGTEEKKPIEFTLIDPHEIDLGTIQFFNQKNS